MRATSKTENNKKLTNLSWINIIYEAQRYYLKPENGRSELTTCFFRVVWKGGESYEDETVQKFPTVFYFRWEWWVNLEAVDTTLDWRIGQQTKTHNATEPLPRELCAFQFCTFR